MDAAVSFYYFYGNWLFELDELSLDDFVDWMIIRESPPDVAFASAYQMRHLGERFPLSVVRLILVGSSFVVSTQKG